MVKTLNIAFEEEHFKELKEIKDSSKLSGKANSWESFILWKCGVKIK